MAHQTSEKRQTQRQQSNHTTQKPKSTTATSQTPKPGPKAPSKNGDSSQSGKREKETIFIYEANALMAPHLVYVDLAASSSLQAPESMKHNIRALHDSGCAKSVMRTDTFLELSAKAKTGLRRNEENYKMVTADGETTEITGTADITIHFEGMNGTTVAYNLNVMIHPKLSQDFLLGRDFTGSSAKVMETNNTMYLTTQPEKLDLSVQEMVKRKILCDVPLITSGSAAKYVATNTAIWIPPHSMVTATCTLQKSPNREYHFPLHTSGETTYEVLRAVYPRVSSLPILHTYNDYREIQIPLFNDTMEDMFIEANTNIAEIELWDQPDTHEVHSYQLIEDNSRTMSCNNVSTEIPDFIAEDDGMSPEEQQEAFMKYIRYGYHHPSMTKQVEEKAGLTEMTLQNTTPASDKELLDQFELAHLPIKRRKQLRELVQRHRGAFSTHPFDLGKAKDIKMKIPITSSEPHIQKYIPIPHSVRPQVREILDQYVERGIIRECDEPSTFCSNILIVKKKDGKSIRLLLDGRLLNSYTQRLPTNLVTQMELLAHLVNKTWVTTIDLSDAFYQIELDPESQPLTAFYSEAHGKRYCFMRCPQGLRNSPLHLKLVMDRLFSHMANDVIHYADDIMIATNGTLAEHLDKVAEVFKKLEEGNIKIRPQKVNIARDTVEFIGVVWQKNQISIPEARVLAFKNLPSPSTPKKLKSMLCALSYYRKFVPDFAELSKPLMDLTTLHHKQFTWTQNHEELFRKLINTICANTTLYLPDPAKPYYVQTDASDLCGAGRVFQKDEDGTERPLACISRTFTKPERAYSTVKKEVLALLYTLRTMDFFLRFANKIIILVDAKAILYLRMCKDASGILLRFSLELSKYNAEVIHVKGENNEVADVLSRQHRDIDKIKEETKTAQTMSEQQTLEILQKLKIPKNYKFTEEEVASMLDSPSLPNPKAKKPKSSAAKTGVRQVKNLPQMLNKRNIKMPKEVRSAPGAKLPQKPARKTTQCNNTTVQCNQVDISYQDFNSISTSILKGTLTAEQFRSAQEADVFCSRILAKVHKMKNYKVIKGLLFFKTPKSTKLVLPSSLLDIVINAKHYSVFGLHFSKSRIRRDISTRYHVQQSAMRDKLQMLKNNCIICQFNINGQKDHELRKTDYIYAPRVTWAIDMIPNMPETQNGNKKALLAVDLFTGYIQICPLKDRTSKSIIEAIDSTIIRPFTLPKFIRTDNEGGIWNSAEFYEYLEPLGVKLLPTSVGSPWANGHAERSIRTIKDGLRNFLLQEKIVENWDKYISLFTNAHNQSTSIYGYAPEELMFGYKKPNATDLLQFWPNARSQTDYAEKVFAVIEERRRKAQEKSDLNKEKNRTYKNTSRIKKVFRVGQVVATRQLQVATGPNSSLKPKYLGPFVVLEVSKNECSCTIENLETGSQSKEHFTNLIHINYHPSYNRVHTNFDSEIQKMVENLHNKKYNIRADTKRLMQIPILPEFRSPDDDDVTDSSQNNPERDANSSPTPGTSGTQRSFIQAESGSETEDDPEEQSSDDDDDNQNDSQTFSDVLQNRTDDAASQVTFDDDDGGRSVDGEAEWNYWSQTEGWL